MVFWLNWFVAARRVINGDTAEKLAGYIKSTVAVLLKQLMGKSSNDVVKQSIEFSKKALFKDAAGNFRVGETLDANSVTNLKNSYAEIKAGKWRE